MNGTGEPDFQGTDWLAVRRKVSEGAFGVVFEAYDERRKGIVAVKTLREFDAEALYMLKQEFRTMADVVHPNLVTLYDLVSEGENCFVTMEFVDGVDLLTWLHEQRADVAMDHARDTFSQLADGVRALHAARILHRDLKPSNVMVTPDGRVVVLDFGLARELALGELSSTIHLAGTVAYMSPEQAAGNVATEASDWYSVGVILHEALTGATPFDGPVLDVLTHKRDSDPPAVRDVAPGAPEDLASLCDDLLRRDPNARPGGREIAQRLGRARSAGRRASIELTAEDRPAALVGRQEHRAVLERSFEIAQQGRPVVVHLFGRSGMGKTTLARHFLSGLRQRDRNAVVLAGRCYEQESVPFKALDNLVDGLSRYLQRLAPLRAQRLMPRDVLALARLFPVLRGVEAIANTQEGRIRIPDAQELRRRAAGALREFLARIADQSPLVLFIDDLQWGDQDSAFLLNELVRPPDPPVAMLLLCYRSEDLDHSPLLRRVRDWPSTGAVAGDMVELEVGELPPGDATKLAEALLGQHSPASPERAAAIARESEGSPLFLCELARHAAAEAETGTTLGRMLRSRITHMDESARKLLELVAVSGRPLDMAVARAAAGVGAEGDPAVAALRAAHLVRIRRTEERDEIETYHDRIRETVVAELHPDVTQSVHRRLASAWEASGRADAETLALHYQGAGDLQHAATLMARAADEANRALAFDRAARLHRRALELWPWGRTEERALQVKIGDALANGGRGAEAAEWLEVAASDAGPTEALELRRRGAEQLLISGHIDEGLAALRTVLAMVGMKLARTPIRAILALTTLRARLRLRGLRFDERGESELSHEDLTRVDTCWSVTIGLSMVDSVRSAHFQSRHLLTALRLGEPRRIARALALEAATVPRGKGSRERAEEVLRLGWEIARRVDDPHAIGLLTLVTATRASFRGRFRESREGCERAKLLLRENCKGVVWELDTEAIFRTHSDYWMGSWRELTQRARALLREAQERHDLYLATYLMTRILYVTHLSADRPDEARREQRRGIGAWSHQGFQVQHYWDWIVNVNIDLYDGRGDAAWQRVRQRWPEYSRSGLHVNQPIYIEALYLRARAALAAATGEPRAEGPGRASRLLRQAEGDARRIEREESSWGHALAKTLYAGVAASRGATDDAGTLAREAEEAFREHEMELHAAAARRRCGELLGGDAGADLVRESDAWMSAQDIVNPGRIASMLLPGRWS